jgi:carboxymethylenebutenolidase
VLGHYAGDDGFFGPDQVAALQETLDGLGKDATLQVHPGVDHAFFNDTRPEVYDEATAQACFAATVDFLKANLS